jgi:hypothetical protein
MGPRRAAGPYAAQAGKRKALCGWMPREDYK